MPTVILWKPCKKQLELSSTIVVKRMTQKHDTCSAIEVKKRGATLDGTMYTDKAGIPIVVRDLILPMFKDLSKPELLQRCLHGKTQNNNECLNGVFWKRLPKDTFVGRTTLEIGTCSAIINFNDGAVGFLNVMRKLCLRDGSFTRDYCLKTDKDRTKQGDRKSTTVVKNARKRSRDIR